MIQQKKLYTGLGVIALVLLMIFAKLILGIVTSLVTIVAGLVIIVAFIVLFPQFLYGLNVTGRKIDESITRANPIEALKIQLKEFSDTIELRMKTIGEADAKLMNLEKLYNDNKNTFKPDKLAEWSDRIAKNREGIKAAKSAISDLKVQYADFQLEIRAAEADVAMAAASDGIAASLGNGLSSPALSDRRTQALDEISQRVNSSLSRVDMALEGIGAKQLT